MSHETKLHKYVVNVDINPQTKQITYSGDGKIVDGKFQIACKGYRSYVVFRLTTVGAEFGTHPFQWLDRLERRPLDAVPPCFVPQRESDTQATVEFTAELPPGERPHPHTLRPVVFYEGEFYVGPDPTIIEVVDP
jgi:hypothetical protein